MSTQMTQNPFSGGAVAVAPQGALASAEQQRAIAEVQARMIIARSNPRSPQRATDAILNECTRPTLAEKGLYAYSKGGTDISGPSIKLIETVARHWGNIQSGIKEVGRSGGYSECVAYAWDLETGYYDERQFQVRHWIDKGRTGRATNDEREIYELVANMGQRRKRAVLTAVIPGDVIEAAAAQCEMTLKANADTSPEGIKKLVDAFAKFGVSKGQIEKRIQRRMDAIMPAQVVNLKKVYASLRDEMSAVSDWFDGESGATVASAFAEPEKTSGKNETINQETGEITGAPQQWTIAEPPALSVATLIKRLNTCKDLDAAGVIMTDPDVDALNAEDASKLMEAYRAKWGDA